MNICLNDGCQMKQSNSVVTTRKAFCLLVKDQAIVLEDSKIRILRATKSFATDGDHRLALTQMRVLTAKLFYHFDPTLRGESKMWVAGETACCRIFREKAPLWIDLKTL